jgi:hypothetical protein
MNNIFWIKNGKNFYNFFYINIWKQNKKIINLAKFIDKIDGLILTNGWWQIPEVSIYTKKIFIDRMSLINKVNSKDKIYLFVSSFQNNYWP